MTVSVITGAASGIGYALAEAMVCRGDTVVLTGRSESVTEAARHADDAGPGQAYAALADVRDAAAVADVVDQTVQRHGRIDVMVNNAGVGIGGFAQELSLQHWERAIDVNIRGVVHGVHAAYHHMVEQGAGHILNVASVAGLVPTTMMAPYAMSKHAVVGLSMSLRGEAAAHGVRVSALCPGVVETPILDKGNPADLPPLATVFPGRALLARANKPVPAAEMAETVLRAMDEDVALIVAPEEARAYWEAYRADPQRVADHTARRSLAWMREWTAGQDQQPRPDVASGQPRPVV